MKKKGNGRKKLFGLFAIGSMSAAVAGCSFSPHGNEPVDIYGPPEMFDQNYDPEKENGEKLYGPPERFGVTDDEHPYTIVGEDQDYDPEDAEVETIYGPPEMFEDEPVSSDTDN